MFRLFDFILQFIKPLRVGLEAAEISVPEKLARIAEKEWERNIEEKTHQINLEITAMFDNNGWGSWLRSVDGGGCPNGYLRPPDPDWCGQAVAHYVLKMSPSPNKKMARKVLVSTYRLNQKDKWLQCDVSFPLVEDSGDIQRGDIVVVRWENGKEYGDHITLAVSDLKEDGTFDTIEGNAKGELPNGSGRGLVKQNRKKDQVARVYRLTKEHFNQ